MLCYNCKTAINWYKNANADAFLPHTQAFKQTSDNYIVVRNLYNRKQNRNITRAYINQTMLMQLAPDRLLIGARPILRVGLTKPIPGPITTTSPLRWEYDSIFLTTPSFRLLICAPILTDENVLTQTYTETQIYLKVPFEFIEQT